jgi:hypothetical protein
VQIQHDGVRIWDSAYDPDDDLSEPGSTVGIVTPAEEEGEYDVEAHSIFTDYAEARAEAVRLHKDQGSARRFGMADA